MQTGHCPHTHTRTRTLALLASDLCVRACVRVCVCVCSVLTLRAQHVRQEAQQVIEWQGSVLNIPVATCTQRCQHALDSLCTHTHMDTHTHEMKGGLQLCVRVCVCVCVCVSFTCTSTAGGGGPPALYTHTHTHIYIHAYTCRHSPEMACGCPLHYHAISL